jgi:hypothetical protein
MAFGISSAYIRITPVTSTQAVAPATSVAPSDPSASRLALREVERLDKALVKLETALRRSRAVAQAASTMGTVALQDIVTPGTYATLTGTAEVNAQSLDYSPINPTWNGTSNAIPTIGGTYDGDQGTDTLKFNALRLSGTLFLNVRDGRNTSIGTASWGSGESVTTARTLSNGLTVALSSRSVNSGDFFNVNVSTDPASVNPATSFGGDPNFEMGVRVNAGSFQVNGASITVTLSDSINTIVSRINSSAANVTASFDATTERVKLVQNTAGATPTITVGSDTSGFLAAVKLSGATVVPGTDAASGLLGTMNTVSELSSVRSGALTVNGTSVAVDPATMSVYDVLDAIETAVPSVSAALNESTGKVIMAAREAGTSFTIDSGGTGFFEALGLSSGTYQGKAGVSSRASAAAAAAMREASDALLALHDDDKMGLGGSARVPTGVTVLRDAFAQVIKARFGKSTDYDTGFGLAFDLERTDDPLARVVSFDRNDAVRFSRAFRHRGSDLRSFFLDPVKDVSKKGLIHGLRGMLDTVRTSLEQSAQE